jgi:hypothetical protein
MGGKMKPSPNCLVRESWNSRMCSSRTNCIRYKPEIYATSHHSILEMDYEC